MHLIAIGSSVGEVKPAGPLIIFDSNTGIAFLLHQSSPYIHLSYIKIAYTLIPLTDTRHPVMRPAQLVSIRSKARSKRQKCEKGVH